jgi:predicted nuclease of predicted toxin-antitoxin system
VKLLIDAQLPHRLVREFAGVGVDALHPRDLPLGNRTPDAELTAMARRDDRVVVTKDADFVATFWLRREPRKLLLISTGNIDNDALWALLAANLPALRVALAAHDFVELNRRTLTIHA